MKKSCKSLIVISSILAAGMITPGYTSAANDTVSTNFSPLATSRVLEVASKSTTTTKTTVGKETAKWEGWALKVGKSYPTGWQTVTTTTTTVSNGKVTTKSTSAKYYLVTDGKKNKCITNEFHSGYWIGGSGKADTSKKYEWTQLKNSKYMFKASNTVYVKNKIVKITGRLYSFDANGYMKTNCWIKYNGVYNYLNENGIPKKNVWVKDNNKWYYVDSTGAMVTGIQTIKGKMYYFDSTGVMLKDQIVKVDNSKYLLDADGVALKLELYKRYTSFPNQFSGRIRNYQYRYNGITETAYSNYEGGQNYGGRGVGYRTASYCGMGGLDSTYGFHVADDGTIRDYDGFIVVATTCSRYKLQKIVMTSMGPGRYYDTSGGSLIDIYTHWQ